jgi:hypothetical protein
VEHWVFPSHTQTFALSSPVKYVAKRDDFPYDTGLKPVTDV